MTEQDDKPAPLLQALHLVKEYPRGHGRVRVVDDVSLTLRAGETLGLVGESGSGKSTVARLMLRLLEPTAGQVLFEGEDLLAKTPRAMRRLRQRMQIVFQDPFSALDPRMRVRSILAEPFAIHGIGSHLGDQTGDPTADQTGDPDVRSRAGRRRWLETRLLAMLAEVGLEGSALDRFPHEFSGGQRQRINIARALALKPSLIVLDEPVSALDVSVGAQVINLLRDLQRAHGLAYLFISHSVPLVRYLCDRVAVMQAGVLVEEGDVLQVCEHPREPYTRRLVAATPKLPVVSP